jgi:3-phenylpropionate/trans-cinnamate dioxygenase ferredoxin reductase subunit
MRIVIVGAGLAAANAVEELRSQGHDGSIALFGAEPHLPYNRPPLSKGFLLGNEDEASIFVHDEQWYADQSVELHLGSRVTGIDLDRGRVHVGTDVHAYDRLLLATGSTPRRLPPADDAGGAVAYLRTLEDSRALKAAFQPGRRIVIVGAGWIGLETAAAARAAGSEVTVVESLDLPLLRVLGPEVAATFAELHRSHGVDLRLGASVEAFTSAGDTETVVRLGDGSEVSADLVLVGIGVTPADELARESGLAVDNGVVVDERLRAADPNVYAAGDVANHRHPILGRRVRVEHWDNAIEQGKVVARTMLGHDEAYTRLPYFFTDQYDLGMEYVGNVGPDGYDEVVLRGDPAGEFTAFWLKGDHVLAGMHVNDWDAIDPIRALVGAVVARDGLADESTDLAALAESVVEQG